jgi:succinylarginine dihydrolase
MRQGVLLTDDLYEKLVNWAEKQYREELHLDDLADPNLITDCRSALDELTTILQLGSIYDFQKTAR